eukprot:4942359-Amphidinium_carterae.1
MLLAPLPMGGGALNAHEVRKDLPLLMLESRPLGERLLRCHQAWQVCIDSLDILEVWPAECDIPSGRCDLIVAVLLHMPSGVSLFQGYLREQRGNPQVCQSSVGHFCGCSSGSPLLSTGSFPAYLGFGPFLFGEA